MFNFIQRIFLSQRLKKIFDTMFDLAILLSVVRLAIVVLAGIFEPFLENHITRFDTILNQKRAVAISLNTLILVKIYKVLHHFLGDHHIKIIDLVEIAITSLIIKMVFDMNYNRESIVLLIIFIGTFWLLNFSQKKGFLIDEETSDEDKMKNKH